MPLTVYNTLTRSLLEFKAAKANRINLFVCGPTVYDLSHLGHARTYIAYDVITKYLKKKGYSLFYIMNITDVDDKIIRRAKELKISPAELAENMTEEFFRDLKALKINGVNLFAKASEHMPEIIEQIETLIADYGKLSRQKAEELVKHRVDPNPNKRNPGDFALWKKHKPEEPAWESPWGKGRPGWHIEDTAITLTYFGPRYDVHGGAVELVFPHHEAEIAQAEAYTGIKPLVNYWIHTGVLTINNRKMSKSLKNFITIREALEKYSPEALRLFFVSSHYRSPIDFNQESLKQSEENVKALNTTYLVLKLLLGENIEKSSPNDDNIINELKLLEEEFCKAMDNDLNTPIALSVVLKASKRINDFTTSKPSMVGVKAAIELIEGLNRVLGFLSEEKKTKGEDNIEKLMEIILRMREKLRDKKEYDLADEIRKQLEEIGIIVEDASTGPKWKHQ
jgi:cysteinyl-tRNA synthetase